MHTEGGLLTDVVIESHKRPAELCQYVSQIRPNTGFISLPLSPFIMTQIREPTHLSMSSVRH